MPRLVVAHPHFTYPGGAGTAVLETVDRLRGDGWDVHLVSLRHLPQFAERFPALQFHDLGGPLSGDLRYWLTLPAIQARFARCVDALHPDVLLASVFPANYWAFTYRARRPAVPCVWYCQEPSAFVHDRQVIAGVPWPMRAAVIAANPVLQVPDRALVRFADEILVNSRFSAGRVRRVYRRPSTVVRLGVDVERFARNMPKERLVLSVARLTRFKRVDILIRAAARLLREGYGDVRWAVAGDGEEAPALRRLADELGVAGRIEFTGRLGEAELADYFGRASIVAVTAIGEPFGLVPLEAMAAGAAVVCSDSGGPAETVRDGLTGLHFRSGDADDCARAIAALLDDPERLAAMRVQGRALVEREYTWERTAAEVGGAISKAITRVRGKSA